VIVTRKEERATDRTSLGILIDVNDDFLTLEFGEGKFGFIPMDKVEKVEKFGNSTKEKEQAQMIIPSMPRVEMHRRIKELGVFEGIVYYKRKSGKWERKGRIWASDQGFSAYVFDEKTDKERKIDLRRVEKIEVFKISQSTGMDGLPGGLKLRRRNK